MKERGRKIQKVLAEAGVCSRRKAEELIRRGLVKLDGQVVDDPALRIDPQSQVLEFSGSRLLPPAKKPSCLILYKTAGFITSAADPHNKKTVYHLLPESERRRRWLYVGRLDRDSEGLLLFTDFGELVHRLTHPSFKVPKRYRVTVDGRLDKSALRSLQDGLIIEGKKMTVDRVRTVRSAGSYTVLELTLHQGEKRQIKRMLRKLGYQVTALTRTHFGPLTLEGLEPGGCRRLKPREIRSLLDWIQEPE